MDWIDVIEMLIKRDQSLFERGACQPMKAPVLLSPPVDPLPCND